MTDKLKRFATSSAYIDSSMIGGFMLGVLVFAGWIGYETGQLVSPAWLTVSIVAVVLYQITIFWLILQYWEPDRILGIFTSNLICLGLIVMLVELVSGVVLPNHLPVLSVLAHTAGYSVTSFSPGAVAISYAVIALIVGLLAAGLMSWIEKLPLYSLIIKRTGLAKLDLMIDYHLDKFSVWLDVHKYGWLVVPQVLLAIMLVLVVGLAAILM